MEFLKCLILKVQSMNDSNVMKLSEFSMRFSVLNNNGINPAQNSVPAGKAKADRCAIFLALMIEHYALLSIGFNARR